MFKISNVTFYNRHNKEIEKYLKNKNSLHVVSKNSEKKINNNYSKKIIVEPTNLESLKKLNNQNKFERILLTDVIENHDDVFTLLLTLEKLLTVDGKLIITSINTKYISIFKLLELLKLKDSNPKNSYIHPKKIENITRGTSLEYQKYFTRQFIPFKIFKLGNFLNILFELIFSPFNLGIKTYMIFRPVVSTNRTLSKSIIIPAKNEEGNLKELVSRIPRFENTEIIFSYGKSVDDTLEVMKKISRSEDFFQFKIVSQTKVGKANAVWEALDVVENEIIAILDADISVEPENLGDFFDIIENNRADFVNGTRLIYEMDKKSMRFLNKLGNRFFQFFISKIIKEPLTDSLCGTKVFKKSYLNDLYLWQKLLPSKDPFGDFDLIFSAAYSGQKIVELPIIYKERRYGVTQISRFKDGYKLLVYLLTSFLTFNSSR